MLAVLFECQRFHKMVYGKKELTVESDHKPLETLYKKSNHSENHAKITTIYIQIAVPERNGDRITKLFESFTTTTH